MVALIFAESKIQKFFACLGYLLTRFLSIFLNVGHLSASHSFKKKECKNRKDFTMFTTPDVYRRVVNTYYYNCIIGHVYLFLSVLKIKFCVGWQSFVTQTIRVQ